MLPPQPTPEEIYLNEQSLSSENDPSLWKTISETYEIPYCLKIQCVHKHDLDYNRCTFYIYEKTKPAPFMMLMCVHNNTLFENKGSGWYYMGAASYAVRQRRHKIIKA